MVGSTGSRCLASGTLLAVALLAVALAGAGTAAATENATGPAVVSALESSGDIEIAFDRPVQAADDGGDVDVDDVEVYVRKGGTDGFDVYEGGFTVTSNSTVEGRVVLTDGPWGDLDPVDTVHVNFTTALENATESAGTTTVTVAGAADDAVERYDQDGDGIDVDELGNAAADYARGNLSIAELGEVAAEYVRF